MDKKKLLQTYETNTWLIQKLAEGVTADESLLRLSDRINNFNWVLGHIVQSRSRLLAQLGAEPVMDEEQAALYASGADVADENAVSLPDLLAGLDESLVRLNTTVAAAPDATFTTLYDAERGTTVADRISGLQWHETYHVGQLEILRQAGIAKPPFP